MDILKISQYMNYEPMLDENPINELESILDQADYITAEQRIEVIQAYEYTRTYHKNVKRLSGEPYIIHPVRVLWFLMSVKPDIPSMKAALLHDLIEDTEVTYEDIYDIFWEEVAVLCDWLVKVSKVRYRGEDRQLETLKKTFLAMGKDLRVIIIKIADRVHNIQTLHYHPKKEKRTRIAEETLKVYVPIAKRLWLYVYQGYLENWAFNQLKPREYKRIYKYVVKQYGNVEAFKNSWIQRLQLLCAEEKVSYESIVWRLKSPYRIYKKLWKYNNDITKIMDVLAFRIITETVSDCYTVLWLIHKHYTPIFSKMKDYIALPKPNGYKSLHTTVLWMFELPVEIQVRTEKMDSIANYWVAAHYAYSDAWKPIGVSAAQSEWIKKLQDIVKKYQEAPDKESFKNELDIEILQNNIFVYTPKWDIIELPQWSTVLDFAFRVHTDIGLKFKNGFINGRIVPIDYKIKTWDIVSIKTFKNKYTANSSWTRFLHTPTAKTKLTRFLRNSEKEELFKYMTEKINKKLKFYNLPLLGGKNDMIGKTHQWDAFESLMFKLHDRQFTITRLIKDTYPEIEIEEKTKATVSQKKQETSAVLTKDWVIPVVVDWNKISEIIRCPECTPKRWEKIIWRSGKDWIKIHTLLCTALDTVSYKKLVETHRENDNRNKYNLEVVLSWRDKPWVLLKILKLVEFLWINVLSITTNPWEIENRTEIILTMWFDHPSKMWFLLDELKAIKTTVKILQTTIS